MTKSTTDQQSQDGTFLAEEFGVPPQKAAGLVARGGVAAAKVEANVRKAQQSDDPLSDVPSPAEPDHELTADTDETRLKPVLHTKNNRLGSG